MWEWKVQDPNLSWWDVCGIGKCRQEIERLGTSNQSAKDAHKADKVSFSVVSKGHKWKCWRKWIFT